MQIEWHPTNLGSHVARTAHGLLSVIHASASVPGRSRAEVDEIVLRYFRSHVSKARTLSNLLVDNDKRSLPDRVYQEFCTTQARARFNTVSALLEVLKEPTGVGMAALREFERRRQPQLPPSQPPPPTSQTHLTTPVEGAGGEIESTTEALAGMSVSKYMDLDLVKAHKADIDLLRRVGDKNEFTPLSTVPGFAECELCNPESSDGLYGAADIGKCPVCCFLMPKVQRSQTMAQFKAEHNGNGPTAANGRCPIPRDVLISHHIDDCLRLRRAVEHAVERGKVPAKVGEPIAADVRAARFAESKARKA
jgi:hypothetical protein